MSNLSLGTVQRALRALADQGIVVRRQGLATFVADTNYRLHHPWHCRFLDDTGTKILPVYAKVLKRSQLSEEGPWTQWLGKGPTFRVDRRLSIAREFIVLSRFYARTDILTYFWKCPLDELNGVNFKFLITRECKLPITHISHDIRQMTFSPQICRVIQMKPKQTGLHFYAVVRAGKNNCIYYQEYFVPPTARYLRFSDRYDAIGENGPGQFS